MFLIDRWFFKKPSSFYLKDLTSPAWPPDGTLHQAGEVEKKMYQSLSVITIRYKSRQDFGAGGWVIESRAGDLEAYGRNLTISVKGSLKHK